MKVSEFFFKLALTFAIIAGVVALFIMSLNNWDDASLYRHPVVFYGFGAVVVILLAIGVIAGVWESNMS